MSYPRREKKQIGKGWLHITKKGVFINVRITKSDLLKLETDPHGNFCLTIAPMLSKELESGATHLVYEDDYIRKQLNDKKSNEAGQY